jgi:hypothetical protein
MRVLSACSSKFWNLTQGFLEKLGKIRVPGPPHVQNREEHPVDADNRLATNAPQRSD